MRAAIELSKWFGAETKRIYGLLMETEEQRDQRDVVEFIWRQGGSITCRELAQKVTKFRSPGAAEAALESLAKAGHGKFEVFRSEGPGRPKRKFVLHSASVTEFPKTA